MATSVKIDSALEERILQIASLRQRSPQGIMLEALEQYAAREEARENFLQEARDSWAAFRETGRHLTGAEVSDWLSRWGEDDAKPVPGCHD